MSVSASNAADKEENEITQEQKEEKMKQIAEEWKDEHENILTEWAEKAMCYRWLHHRSHMSYRQKNAMYTIPVIVISTLTGTANFALDRFSSTAQQWAVMVIGALNISAGIISTVSQFLKISEINEGHRVASIAWDKFYRNIKLELNKAPKERRHPLEMLKLSKEEYDRLTETSPMIQDNIIKLFKKSFDFIKMKNELSLPEILDDLEHVDRYDRNKNNEAGAKYEIRNEDIIEKLHEVIGENTSNPNNPINVRDVTKKIKEKMEIELASRKTKRHPTISQDDEDDFVIELKPQLKYKNGNSYIGSPSSTIQKGPMKSSPSFMIGAHAVRINEMENHLEAETSNSENSLSPAEPINEHDDLENESINDQLSEP
jgi:hypothetical protein